MATTVSTKQQLSAALRALSKVMPFDRVTVVALCARSGISRKTFYYHFKDKYDLLTWLFEREVMDRILRAEPLKFWGFYELLARYLAENRGFYGGILSGRDGPYLLRILRAFLRRHSARYLRPEAFSAPAPEQREACLDFLSAACAAALEEWLRRRPHLAPETFVALFRFDQIMHR